MTMEHMVNNIYFQPIKVLNKNLGENPVYISSVFVSLKFDIITYIYSFKDTPIPVV